MAAVWSCCEGISVLKTKVFGEIYSLVLFVLMGKLIKNFNWPFDVVCGNERIFCLRHFRELMIIIITGNENVMWHWETASL